MVASRFADDPASRKEGRAGLTATVCTDDASRPTCAYARLVSPFRQLTRYDASGRRLWSWQVEGGADAVQLLGSVGADCLSPDGRYLTVELYYDEGGSLRDLGPGVLALTRPGLARVAGLGGDTDAVIGWTPGRPTLLVVEPAAGLDYPGPPQYRSSVPKPRGWFSGWVDGDRPSLSS